MAGIAASVGTLVANAPASLVAPFVSNLAYRHIDGTIWRGAFHGASISGVPLGDMRFSVSPISILTLSPKALLTMSGGAVDGDVKLSSSLSGRVTLRDLKADIYLNAIAPYGLLGAPTNGVARLDILKADFAVGKGCLVAEGNLWTNALNGPARRFNMPPLPLSGALSCDGGAFVADVAGGNEIAATSLVLRLEPNLRYAITATAEPKNEEIATALRYYGFEGEGKSLSYGAAGVIKGAGS